MLIGYRRNNVKLGDIMVVIVHAYLPHYADV